jgi:ABC-2 type transport system permease protein
MTRTLAIARAELLAIVGGKTFIIGLLMMPVLAAVAIGLQSFADRRGDVGDHRVAVIDRSGVMYDALEQSAAEHNREAMEDGTRTGPVFLLERVPLEHVGDDDLAWRLSERIRSGDLFAFVDIPASIVDTTRSDADDVRYYSGTPSYSTLPAWLRRTVEREAAAVRFATAGLDAGVVDRYSRATSLTTLDLVARDEHGAFGSPREINRAQTMVVPFVMVYLLVFAVMSAAPQLLTAVVEEKMGRVSEVLLASVSPAQLMAGKLLGGTAVAVLLAVVYVLGGIYLALRSGQADLIQWRLILWLLVFLVAAVVGSGAMFVAAGAASSDVKDSQNLMQPLTLVVLLPALATPIVALSPHSTLSVVLSMLPTAAAFLMPMRLAMTPPPPLWQVAVALIVTGVSTAVLVWISGRIFRVGLLMQGKAPNLPELLRWIRQ